MYIYARKYGVTTVDPPKEAACSQTCHPEADQAAVIVCKAVTLPRNAWPFNDLFQGPFI